MTIVRLIIVSLFITITAIPAFGKTPEEALYELSSMGIEYNSATFIESIDDGNTDIVKLFIEAGANPNTSDEEFGFTALMNAAISNQVDIVKLLLENGADVNAVKGGGYTALYVAVSNGRADIAKLLLDAGANVNIRYEEGQIEVGYTPLMVAASKGDLPIVELLLQKGSDPNSDNGSGYTTLMTAVDGGNIDVVRLLLDKGAAVNSKTADGSTALIDAVSNNDVPIVKLLLERGADTDIKANENSKDYAGKSALMIAEENGFIEIAKLIKDRKARYPLKYIFGLIIWLIVLSSTVWVYFDAMKYSFKYTPGVWVLFCLLCWIVAFPMYILGRSKARKKSTKNVGMSTFSGEEHCPKCGWDNMDREQCPNCGTVISEYISEKEQEVAHVANSDEQGSRTAESAMKKCIYCYSDIDNRATYCPHCQRHIGCAHQPNVMGQENNLKLIFGLIGSALLIVGVFTPIVGVPLSSLNYFQNGKGDGMIILILAAISIILTIRRTYKGLWVTGLGSIAVMAFTLVSFNVSVSDAKHRLEIGQVDNIANGMQDLALQAAQLQWGWGVLLLGAISIIAAAGIKGNNC